jgi:CheY-like chemotaxis protein
MGSAVIKQRSAEKLMQEPIDLDTFSDLTKEYERLKNAGLSVEEIHKILSFRLHTALNSVNVEFKQENGDKPSGAEDEVREARFALLPAKVEDASALEVATSVKKEVESQGTVLLVDDSVLAMKVSAKILTNLNFEVVMCYSAQDGYDKLIESPHKFSLVLLDIVMPKIDGVELLSWIKDKPEIAHVKVYMLSGLEDQTLAGFIILFVPYG